MCDVVHVKHLCMMFDMGTSNKNVICIETLYVSL